MKRLIIIIAVLSLSLVGVSGALFNGAQGAANVESVGKTKIHSVVLNQLDSLKAGDKLSVIVTMQAQANLRSLPARPGAEGVLQVERALQQASTSQRSVLSLLRLRQLQGSVSEVHSFWIFNGLAISATRSVIEELAGRTDVASIDPNRVIPGPSSEEAKLTQPGESLSLNISVIHADQLWSKGYRGQGIVIASLDTGVDVTHPALSGSWRGGPNSWFDPYNEHPDQPTDLNGHGTWTMGVMVGSDPSGFMTGMAPEAQWISARIFDDQNQATIAAIHQAFEWVLDPDGDPTTSDAPDIVNNSWSFQSPGCYLEFQPDLQALRAAGILPIFAAGNSGPWEMSSVSPSNYPEAFAVGAINNLGEINPGSSRGTSSCGEGPTTFPEIVAPGVDILSTGLQGGYASATGTSLAAPHVSGALALLLSAYPGLTLDEQEDVLIQASHDLGAVGPDNDFGYGELDVLQAYDALVAAHSDGTTIPDTGTAFRLFLPITSEQLAVNP